MENEKVIIYADFNSVKSIFDSFSNLSCYISCIVDENYEEDRYKDIVIYNSLEEAFKVFGKNNKLVISDTKKEKKIKYKNKTSFRLWFLDTLKTKSIVHRPPVIRFDICTKCQLNCVGCYMRINNNGDFGSGYLKYEQFEKFVNENKFVREIEISNSGEVFLNPDLIKILELAALRDIKITMNNGVNFNTVTEETIEALVKYHVIGVTFSIDGTSDETYSKYRRNGNYSKVINNIKLLIKYKKKYNSIYPYLTWQYILMNTNECDIEKAIKKAKELGIDIYFKKDWSGEYKPKNPKKIFKLTGLSYEDNGKESEYCNPVCMQLLTSPQINWDGRVFGCCTNFKASWNGNVLKDDLMICLNSDKYRKSIYRLLGDTESINQDDPCVKCWYFDEFDKKGKYLYM